MELHVMQQVARLSAVFGPPFDTEMMWSSVAGVGRRVDWSPLTALWTSTVIMDW